MSRTLHYKKHVDITKGIGIVIVTMSHCVCANWAYFANGFFVPLFFFVSGLTLNQLSLKKKFPRLIKPYLFFSVLFILLNIISHQQDINKYNLLGVFYSRYQLYANDYINNNLIFMNLGNATLWFLTSMFSAFVLLKLILISGVKNQVVISSIYILIAYLLTYSPILLPWSIDTAFIASVFMVAGMNYKRIKATSWKWIVLAIVVYGVAVYLNGYTNMSVREYGRNILLFFITGITGSFITVELSKNFESSRFLYPLKIIGQHSLTIFCLQIPLLKFIQRVVCAFTTELYICAICQIILTLVIGTLISKLIYKYIPTIIK